MISKNLFSLEKGNWTFVKDDDWCYIGSLPVKSDLPETKKRGNNYILVYKIVGSDENIVQVEAGYKYNLEKNIVVKIDNTSFGFYSTEDSSETAWTNDDSKVIYAMKKGLELVLSGESSRGTITNDIKKTVKALKEGQIEIKNDKDGNIGASIGKKSFSDNKIIENFNSLIQTIQKEKPSGIKGDFILSSFITSTMGISYQLKVKA